MQEKNQNKQTIIPSHDELILVVKREYIFAKTIAWQGLNTENNSVYLEIIQAHKEFLPRNIMEQDPSYKQIIPYLIYKHENHYFLMQRHAQASEIRLQNKYTLGIGGHIRQEDMGSNLISDWATREFHEEVSYSSNLTITPLGILNDDSNSVGQVHLGFVFLLEGDSPQISIKSELKSGELVSITQCHEKYAYLESWSQFVVNYLLSTTNGFK